MVGSWVALDWNCDTSAHEPIPEVGARVRMFHGALIPHGPYQGWILTFGMYAQRSLAFLWNPSNPSRLFWIKNTWGGAPRHVDTLAMTWDDEGQLVFVGPRSTTGGPFSSSYRMFPAALNYPPVEPLPWICGTSISEVRGDGWRQPPNFSVARYRPALYTMAKGLLPSTVLADSVLMLGGDSFVLGTPLNDGVEYWQALSPRSTPGGSTWSSTLIPNPPPTSSTPLSGVPTETYDLRPPLTESKMQAVPTAFQMGDSGQQGSPLIKTGFVPQDSFVSYPDPASAPSHSAGRTYVVRPRYEAAMTRWELIGAPELLNYQRSQGSAVLRHDLNSTADGYDGKNRVFSLGGVFYNTSAGSGPIGWIDMKIVFEYRTTLQQDMSNGSWNAVFHQPGDALPRPPVTRIDNNAVLLPTGDILVVGGGRLGNGVTAPPNATQDQLSQLASQNQPIHAPQLLRPGREGTNSIGAPPQGQPWSEAVMATAPARVAYGNQPVPRGHGHAAVLLPDGRVLVWGGDMSWAPTPATAALAFTGEVFSPPYLFYGFRPNIVSLSSTSLAFGANFNLTVSRLSDEVVDAIVLLRPASTCYGFDSSQRYIELDFTPGEYDAEMGTQVFSVTAPTDDLGPKGHYLLHVVSHRTSDAARLAPSVGQFITLN